MKILYIDTGLRYPDGHLASSALSLPPAFRRLGHQVTILGHRDLAPGLQREIGALPFFRIYTWQKTSPDPLVGWMVDFAKYVNFTVADLHHAWQQFGPFDFVYVNTARPVQLAATGLWLKEGFPNRGAAPAIVVQLGTTPALFRSQGPSGSVFSLRDPSTLLHRYATNLVDKEWMEQITLVAVNRTIAEEYSYIVDLPVVPVTAPEELPAARQRTSTGALTLGFMGHQRIDKGYEFLPDLISLLLSKHARLRFIVQHSDPDGRSQAEPERMARVTAQLRSLADRASNIELILKPATGAAWFSLIDRCDIVALPYEPANYVDSYSAILGEALASGAVIVAPAGTTMADEITRAGGVGTTFNDWTVESVATAIDEAVERFADLAQRASVGGRAWRKKHGPDAYVSAVIEAAGFSNKSNAVHDYTEVERPGRQQFQPEAIIHPKLNNGASIRKSKRWLSRIRHSIWRHQLARILNVEVETSKRPFEYSLILKIGAEIAREVPRDSRLRVHAVIEVKAGELGLVWVDKKYQLVSSEKTIAAKQGVQQVAVSAPITQAYALILRNVGAAGESAVFILRWLSVNAVSNSATQQLS
ncbi:MAG: hypothetical protein J0H44_29560 [Alphaproteobacteria bacterium]|nr:hypothetical protein [Alphaproteobacteria bacterium]